MFIDLNTFSFWYFEVTARLSNFLSAPRARGKEELERLPCEQFQNVVEIAHMTVEHFFLSI